MIPRLNSCFQMSSVLTIAGSFHLASPFEALVQNPGSTEFAIACRVSWSKPAPARPWTKPPQLAFLNSWQTFSHSSRVLGGFRLCLSNSPLLIQSVPEYTAPTDRAVSFPCLSVSPLQPAGATLDCQSSPNALVMTGVMSWAKDP